MQIEIDENNIRSLAEQFTDIVKEQLLLLTEGIDIDKEHNIVSFNSTHQNNVDTNDYIHPYIIQNNVRGESILSIFERKDNEDRNDGNPLVYALKGLNGWTFGNPKHDITALLRRFVAVTQQLKMSFDTLIITPSSNQLNSIVFSYLKRLISFDTCISDFFEKLMADEVYEFYIDYDYYKSLAKNDKELTHMNSLLYKAFAKMNVENKGIFSYKYINPLPYRDGIMQSLRVSFKGHSVGDYQEAINGKDVLVFDDTVASGKTLSDSAEAIREMFDPNSITFLTLFSPKTRTTSGVKNNRIYLGEN